MKIAHIITSLNAGGAEHALKRLIIEDKVNAHIVISLQDNGVLHNSFIDNNISVYQLDFKTIIFLPYRLWVLYKILRKSKADVVQTWMYHSDLIGGIIGKIAGIKNIFWGIRGPLYREFTNKKTMFIARICSLLSYILPCKIICNSHHARNNHIEFGYCKEKMQVIYNGYLIPINIKEESFKVKEPSLSKKNIILGSVGRFDPHKNHLGLITALSKLKEKFINFECYLIGKDLDENNTKLTSLIRDYKLDDHLRLMGQVEDVSFFYKKMDLFILNSIAESFPNVIAEAMIHRVPCISTNVGDAKDIILDGGWIVPVNDPASLSKQIYECIQMKKNEAEWMIRQNRSREIILENFSMQRMLRDYNIAWSNNDKS